MYLGDGTIKPKYYYHNPTFVLITNGPEQSYELLLQKLNLDIYIPSQNNAGFSRDGNVLIKCHIRFLYRQAVDRVLWPGAYTPKRPATEMAAQGFFGC